MFSKWRKDVAHKVEHEMTSLRSGSSARKKWTKRSASIHREKSRLKARKKQVIAEARVLYDYVHPDGDAGFLRLKAGDKIFITDNSNQDWCRGFQEMDADESQGYFPASYVSMELADQIHERLRRFKEMTFENNVLSMSKVSAYRYGPHFEISFCNRLFIMLLRDASADSEHMLIQTLIGLGCDVNQTDTCKGGRGRTPLMLAAKMGHIQCLKLLIQYNANVAAQDHAGHTALHFAAFGGNQSCVTALVRAGARVCDEDRHGRTALHYAFKKLRNIQQEEELMRNDERRMEREMEEAFKQIDEDESGALSRSELRVYASSFEEIEWPEISSVLDVANKESWTFEEFLGPISRNARVRAQIYDSIVVRKIRQREEIQNELVRYLLDNGADLAGEDNFGIPVFSFSIKNKWYDDAMEEMLRVFEHPREKGYDSEIFKDRRTHAAVQMMWQRKVLGRDVRSFCLHFLYIVMFFVVTVYYATRFTSLTSYAPAALREALIDEEFDKPTPELKSFLDIRSVEDIWKWQDNVFAPALYDTYTLAEQRELGLTFEADEQQGRPIYDGPADGVVDRNETTYDAPAPAFARFFRLIGRPRIRTLRSTALLGCEVDERFRGLFQDTCFDGASPEQRSNYTLCEGCPAVEYDSTNGSPFWGEISVYPSGGYSVILPENRTQGREILRNLKRVGFIDLNTRAVFIEFTAYNGNLDLFVQATLLFEFPTAGYVMPTYRFSALSLLQFTSRSDGIVWTVLEAFFYVFMTLKVLFMLISTTCSRCCRPSDPERDHKWKKYGPKCYYLWCARRLKAPARRVPMRFYSEGEGKCPVNHGQYARCFHGDGHEVKFDRAHARGTGGGNVQANPLHIAAATKRLAQRARDTEAGVPSVVPDNVITQVEGKVAAASDAEGKASAQPQDRFAHSTTSIADDEGRRGSGRGSTFEEDFGDGSGGSLGPPSPSQRTSSDTVQKLKSLTVDAELEASNEIFHTCNMLLFEIPLTEHELVVMETEYPISRGLAQGSGLSRIIMALLLATMLIIELVVCIESEKSFAASGDALQNDYTELGPLFTAITGRNGLMGFVLLWECCTLVGYMTWLFTFVELTMVVWEMLGKILTFVAVLASYFVGFAVFDYVLFGVAEGQKDFLDAIWGKFSQGISGVAFEVGTIYDTNALSSVDRIVRDIFNTIFVFMIILLVLNLLIAFMADAYTDVKETARARFCYKQFSAIMDHEDWEESYVFVW
eukprot:g1568.t1